MSRTAQRRKKRGGARKRIYIPDDELAEKRGEGVGQDDFFKDERYRRE